MVDDDVKAEFVKSVNAIAEALAKAQSEIKPPLKNRHVDYQPKNGGPRVKYSYADLADVIEALRIPLSKNGLSIAHCLGYNSKGSFGLKTFLLHSTGQSLDTWYPLPDPEKQQIRAQEFGSALTYARRYSLSSLVGIASEEDDDGQIAAPANPPQKPQNNSKPAPKGSAPKPKSKGEEPASEELLSNISFLAQTRGVSEKEIVYLVNKGYGFNGPTLTKRIALEIADLLSQEDTNSATLMARAAKMQNQAKATSMAIKDQVDPALFRMPLGQVDVKDKQLKEIPEAKLKEILEWARVKMKDIPPPQNLAEIHSIQKNITEFLKSVGVS